MRLLRTTAALVLVFALACAHAPQKTVTGWVSDAMCGAQHVGGKNPECVRKCVKGGAHVGHPEWTAQAMVVVVDGTGEILVVENPEVLAGREAQHVTVSGDVKADHIRVRGVKPAA